MSVIFWIILILQLLFIYSQFVSMNGEFNNRYKKLYTKKFKSGECQSWPNGSVFGLAWTFIYATISVSFITFMWNLTASNFSDFSLYFNIWDTTMLLFVINIILNKIWSVVFMEGTKDAFNAVNNDNQSLIMNNSEMSNGRIIQTEESIQPKVIDEISLYSFIIGAIIIAILIITGIAICVLLAIQSQWLSFGFFVPYNIWLLYALYLNISVYIFVKEKLNA